MSRQYNFRKLQLLKNIIPCFSTFEMSQPSICYTAFSPLLEPAFFVKFYTDHISYVKSDQILAPAHEGDRTRNREVPGSIPGPSNFFFLFL